MQHILAIISIIYTILLAGFLFYFRIFPKKEKKSGIYKPLPWQTWLSMGMIFVGAIIFLTVNVLNDLIHYPFFRGISFAFLIFSGTYYTEQFPENFVRRPWSPRFLGLLAILLAFVFLHPVNSQFLDSLSVSIILSRFLWLVYGTFLFIFVWLRLTRKKKTLDLRQKDMADVLLISISFSAFAMVCLGFVFPLIQQYGFWKDVTFASHILLHISVLFFVTTAFAVYFFSFFDFRTFALRLTQCLFISLSIAVIFAFLADTKIFAQSNLFWIVLGFVFFAFFLGIIYRNFFFDALTHFFFPQLINPNTVKLRLFEYRKLASGDIDIAGFLKEIVDLVHAFFPVKKSIMLTRNHFFELVKYEFGGAQLELTESDRRVFVRIFRRLKIGKKTLKELHENLLLEKDYLSHFSEYKTLNKRYPRLMRGFTVLTNKLHEKNCKIILPLIFENEVYGVFFIGQKQKERPYYTYDLKFLQSIRSILTMLVRNRIYIDEMNYQRLEARKEVHSLTNFITLEKCQTYKFMDKSLVYKSNVMQKVIMQAKEAAENSFPVLLTGQTGTGKDMIAQFIHDSSEQKNEPFVHINCAAIPEYLWEDKIFGHTKGAFTDAKESRIGMVAAAGKGTLFFDEIGEMPLEMQPKLLQLIQEGKYYPLGSEKPLQSQCRLIFATNRDLKEMIEQKKFRDDLYYRIHVLPIHIAPLVQRRDDVLILVEHFIQKYRRDCNEPGDIQLDQQALNLLTNYDWPGNVRELENIIIRVLATKKGKKISLDDIPSELRSKIGSASIQTMPTSGQKNKDKPTTIFPVNFDELVKDFSSELIKSAMEQTGGNISKAADLLNMKRARLSYQVKELGIKQED